MSRTNVNILSALLILVFILSCFTFFGVSAEDVEETTTTTTTTTEVVTTTTTTTKVSTNAATVADPVYTSKTSKTQQTTIVTATSTEATTGYYAEPITKETKDIIETEATTEPTTPAKNITNYASKYRPLKWISLVLMISCVIALIVVNVRYQKVHGKGAKRRNNLREKSRPSSRAASQRSSGLDTQARFTDSSGNQQQRRMEDVDISSHSRKQIDEEQFKRRRHIDDDIFGVKNNDDDLFI